MARIAIGGFQHETNTFSPTPASFADFEAPDAWPGLTRGGAMLEAVAGINLPAAGFVQEARSLRHELVPLTWCSAQPSGRVTRDAFERISALLLDDLRRAGSVDGVYLDLHGAMVAEHIDDADGELLRRVRALVGPDVPIVASLDYHANVSALMARPASALVSYRTYPHVDMAECGARGGARIAGPARTPATGGGARAGRLPDAAHVAVDAGGADALADGPGPAAAAAAAAVGLPHAGLPGGGRCRLRAGGLRLRLRRRGGASTRWRTWPAKCVAREHEFALELYSIEQAIAETTRHAGAARPADHPRRHPGQPGRRRQRGHDEPDQGPRRFQRAAPCSPA